MAKSSLIGRIAFDLVANTGKLTAPLKTASASVAKFVGAFSNFTGIGAAISGALAGFVSIDAAVGRITKAFSELGAISDESKRIGVSADALSALQYAAKQSGVEAETLGKSLQFLMKSGKSVGSLFKIADELERIPDPVIRMQKALAYFGRGGSGMINMLSGGSRQLKEMLKDAERLGYVVTQSQADLAESAGDAWERIGIAIDGAARQLTVVIAPYVEHIANILTDWVVQMRTAGSQLANIADSAAAIADAFQWLYLLMQVSRKLPDITVGRISSPQDLWKAGKELWKAFNSESWGDKLRVDVEKIKDRVSKSTDSTNLGSVEDLTTSKFDFSPLERGSQAAFSAIIAYDKQNLAKDTFEETRKSRVLLETMAKSRGVLAPALLAGA